MLATGRAARCACLEPSSASLLRLACGGVGMGTVGVGLAAAALSCRRAASHLIAGSASHAATYHPMVQCADADWLVMPFDDSVLPADLYAEQKYARAATSAPLPAGAYRPTAADAADACGPAEPEGALAVLACAGRGRAGCKALCLKQGRLCAGPTLDSMPFPATPSSQQATTPPPRAGAWCSTTASRASRRATACPAPSCTTRPGCVFPVFSGVLAFGGAFSIVCFSSVEPWTLWLLGNSVLACWCMPEPALSCSCSWQGVPRAPSTHLAHLPAWPHPIDPRRLATPLLAQVLAAAYLAAYKEGAFGSPAALPEQYSRVCVPDPGAASRPECQQVRAGQGQGSVTLAVNAARGAARCSAHRWLSWLPAAAGVAAVAAERSAGPAGTRAARTTPPRGPPTPAPPSHLPAARPLRLSGACGGLPPLHLGPLRPCARTGAPRTAHCTVGGPGAHPPWVWRWRGKRAAACPPCSRCADPLPSSRGPSRPPSTRTRAGGLRAGDR